MANYHFTVKPRSRKRGKSTVEQLAYRSGTDLLDARDGETHYYSKKGGVFHVDILLPEGAPQWIVDIAHTCQSDKQSALQKLSNIFEAAEKRKDSRVYREAEFSLPNELTNGENIEWSKEFVRDFFCTKGMVAITNYHSKVDKKTGIRKPHCHVLLSTRNLTEEGLNPYKNLDWNSKDLVNEGREEFEHYQNAVLKKLGFNVQVTCRSLADREAGVDPQPKLGGNVQDMTMRGIETDKQKVFDLVRLKNQFKIVKNPEIVFDIVTSKHATFTRKDIAKILNRYVDDAGQFQVLLDRLMTSKELVFLQPKTEEEVEKGTIKEATKEPEKEEGKEETKAQGKEQRQGAEKGPEPVYTTRKMVRAELELIKTAEVLATRQTHPVPARITNRVVARYHKKFKKDGGLSADQERAIRHTLSGEQISCVVGFAGAGKTTCLEAANEAWEEAGYSVLGLAPTGKAERSIAACGIRSMTVHRFLRSREQGRERISRKTIVVLDEAGMLDSRRFSELQAIVAKTGAKIVPMGDGNQTQAVEAGPPFRLVTDRVAPAVLETIVRQRIDWQRDASRFFGTLQPRKALKLYQENGCFHGIEEKKPDLTDESKTIDNYCLARQISGHIWEEMREDTRAGDICIKSEKEGTGNNGSAGKDIGGGLSLNRESTIDSGSTIDFEAISQHQDYATHTHWKNMRHYFVQTIIQNFDIHKAGLEARDVNVTAFEKLVVAYKAAEGEQREILFEGIENTLRKMSYKHIFDTRVNARQALVEAWAMDRKAFPEQSHLMLAFTTDDAHKLNEAARVLMREQGVITGFDITYKTQTIEEDPFGVEYREYHDRTFAKGDRILFTRNDKGLEVSNGTLGTVLALSPRKFKVALDENGSGNKTVSFSPRLYPFFDNGWGTTIRKAQSATVDQVKFLGSWEDYRNLAYVALTRHRNSLKLFFSDLDFWRPEKLSDRLSRIQEKLSGLDYLDAEKLQEQLKEDTEILWHHWHLKKVEDGIQQGKDFWAAIKVTAQDVFETIIPPKKEEHTNQARLFQACMEEEAFLSLEDSEEMRSRNFFKESELADSRSPADGRPHEGDSSFQERAPQLPKNTPPGSQQREGTSVGQVSATQVSVTPDVDFNRLNNQSKIMKDPEIILDIVTAKHSTFTKKDIARVLNEHIDDPILFQVLYDRLSNSKELINLERSVDQSTVASLSKAKPLEPVFTTQKMLRIEKNLVSQAEAFAARNTHPVAPHIIEGVITRFHKKFEEHGGLSPDQERAIRHMLSGEQISCVVGFAGAGKTTCLEAVKEGWEEAGYSVLGLAPTGKAQQSIEACGIRSMTIHKFLKNQKAEGQPPEGKISLSSKTVVVIDEAGMVDSRRFGELQSLVAEAGAKIVPMGDNNQLQSIEAGPAFRLVCGKVKPVVLETVVRQRVPWQREATRLFGMGRPRQALALYQKEGAFEAIQETIPTFSDLNRFIENFCLTRQISGRIWKEIGEDYKAAFGTAINFEEKGIFEVLAKHQDFDLYTEWKDRRKGAVENIIQTFDQQKAKLKILDVDVEKLGALVAHYQATPPEGREPIFEQIEKMLRKMSNDNIVDTRVDTKQALVAAWAADLEAAPERSHLMLAFTNTDTKILNESARLLMREKGKVVGPDYQFETKSIEEDYFGNIKINREARRFAQGDRILFTLNKEALGVKNGSLGTILSLDQETITVVLDGKDNRTLSFSPAAYPFIDNGWATNIHTSQSATAGDVKLLGSFEQYRNMVYVGMTRHWNSLKVYVSDLDFWREEKIFDRLSRVQEKLSGFDYLDEAAILEKLGPEKPAPAQEDIQENLSGESKGEVPEESKARDGFWRFLKMGISRGSRPSTFFDGDRDAAEDPDLTPGPDPASKDPILKKSPQSSPKTDLLDESYLNLENTEEKRSSDIFKDPFDTRGKGAFSETEDRGGQTEEQKSQSRPSTYAKGPPSQKDPGDKQEGYGSSAKTSTSTAHNQENIAHLEQQTQEHSNQKESRDKSPAPSPASTVPAPDPAPASSPSSSLTHEEFKEKLKAIQDKITRDYATQTVIKEKPLSYKEIDTQLRKRIFDLATHVLGKPTSQTRESLRFGRKGSVCVFISGERQGIYTDFGADGKGKDPLKMIEEQKGLSAADARQWAVNWLGGNQVVVEQRIVAKPPDKRKQTEPTWKPIVPVPKNVPPPDIGKCLTYMLKDGYQEVARHAYRDEQGNLKGYVVRLEKRDGDRVDKKTPPLAWGKDVRGSPYWKSKAFYEKESRTPYGIEKLAQDQGKSISKPVLVVEGEKTADKAQKDFPGYHVLTWVGGAGAVDKTNWACLVGRDVTIWPDYDYDEKSQKAAQKLHQTLTQLNKDAGKEGRVGVVDLPDNLREGPEPLKDGWDLADPLPRNWMLSTIEQMIREALPQQDNDKGQDKEQRDQRQDNHEEIPAKEKASPSDESVNVHNIESKTEAEPDASPPSPASSFSDVSLRREDSEARTPETSSLEASSPVKIPKKPSPLMRKQEKFEKGRLSFHQEWCTHLGFFAQHKRFPNKEKEIAAAWWQGERLTAIEGRLYKEALERKEEPDEKQLTLDARAELAKNQKAPGHIMTLGKASDLDKAQLKQFEQHVLIHQDKTGQLPKPSDLDTLCQAIKVRSQIMGAEGGDTRIDRQGAIVPKTPEPTPGEKTSEKTPDPALDMYRTLIEQQAVLARLKGDGLNSFARSEEMVAALQSRDAIQVHDIRDSCRDSCSERMDRLNAKIQSVKEFSQEMKALDRSRQNQRGIEM